MKKTGLLNHRLSDVVARMGHTQRLVVSDAGLPIPRHAVARLFPGASASSVPHVEFKRMTEDAVAVVRTGECSPYYNVILISGVTY